MNKQAILPMPEYYDRYIALAPDQELAAAFQQSLQTINTLDMPLLETYGNYSYAPGKWSVKTMFQHVTDTERIFTYRALVFSRNDDTPLPPFDENEYAANSHADERPLTDIMAELKLVRQSTIALFNSFTDGMLLTSGNNYKINMSVLAMGYTIIGHQQHHLNILKERYLPAATYLT
ncbi:DinB family protein [Chitinophaga nivalis]|uniref:DinB family protein n=1 Tax=Chitinophaga nivalis TaxID=2991709 RepID=A0ABT3IWD0_9BACT|nr:DinB family protein [Chitinophaga nivalis]MCW3462011.1 DinB family protein [Chitinophaga nivalis]MCW3488297.1 DinB family protein [Chitinophaga nivalis]